MSLNSKLKFASFGRKVLISVPVCASLVGCNAVDSNSSSSLLMKASSMSSLSELCLSQSASVVGLSDTRMSMSGNASIGGSVILLGRSTLDLSGNASVTDRVYSPMSNAVVEHGNASVGQLIDQDLTANESAVLDFATTIMNQTPTQTIDRISNSVDIVGNGDLNVIEVKNGIQLSGQNQLRLHGTADDQFVFIVDQGNIQFSGKAGIQLLGNVSSRRVMFLATGRQSLSVTGNGAIVGTYFLPEGPASISGNGRIEGALLAESSLAISGNGLTFTPAAWCPAITLPEPTPSASPSPSASPTASASPSPSVSASPSASPTADPSASPSPSTSPTADPSASPSPTDSASPSPSASPTVDPSPSPTPTETIAAPTPSPSPTLPICTGPFCGSILGGT